MDEASAEGEIYDESGTRLFAILLYLFKAT